MEQETQMHITFGFFLNTIYSIYPHSVYTVVARLQFYWIFPLFFTVCINILFIYTDQHYRPTRRFMYEVDVRSRIIVVYLYHATML